MLLSGVEELNVYSVNDSGLNVTARCLAAETKLEIEHKCFKHLQKLYMLCKQK